jgi:hypothetical protein
MHVAQPGDHLEFDDDLILDQEAGGLVANDHVVIKDNAPPLLDDAKPAFAHLVSQSVLGNLVNEPITERVGNPESAPNDPRGRRLQQQRIPCIHLHPVHPP